MSPPRGPSPDLETIARIVAIADPLERNAAIPPGYHALSEAGASNQQSPAENKRRLAKSKRKERKGETGKARAEGGARGRKKSAAASAPKTPAKRVRTSA